MIILKSDGLCFLKPKKTAGTSFEIALSKFATAEDIITRIREKDEVIRTELGFRGPQNYRRPLHRYRVQDIKRKIRRKRVKDRYTQHMTASEVRKEIGKDDFDALFKVSMVRNPYDMAVSNYHWDNKRLNLNMSFEEWAQAYPGELGVNNAFYFDEGALCVDHFIRFDNMAEDIEVLESKFPTLAGLSGLMSRIKSKDDVRPKSVHFSEYYQSNTHIADNIRAQNAAIIERFGYALQ